jgi:DNA-binding CsgD family transcriptional regulator
MLYWGSFFSLVPTRYTRVAIVSASTGGTVLFIIVACITSESIFLLSYALLAALSLALAYYLSLKIKPQAELSSQHFWPIPPTTWKRGLSIGSHSLAHGFVVTSLFHMGFEAVVIGCASGLIGDALCFAWLRNKRIDVDVSLFQRITLPFILLGLLLFPIVSDTGRLLCCCLVNICLAHFITMTWANSAVANSEFKLHPLKAFASIRIPNMLGFLIGTIYAAVIFFYLSLDTRQLYLAITGIVVLIVVVSMIYGMDDSIIKRRLANLLTYENKAGVGVGDAQAGVARGGASGDAETNGALSDKRVAWYRAKCEAIVERYDLSPREAEVFMLLAKGRTADYIGSKLVISNSTAKTHIYHIYQKLGINTQQRLMDIVEDDAGASG